MAAPTTEEGLAFHARATARFAELLRRVPDPSVRVPNLTWTIAETGAHVLSTQRACLQALRTGVPVWSDPSQGPAENERLLAATPEREPKEIADALDAETSALREAYAAHGDEPATWVAGTTLSVGAICGIEGGDALVHGWDVSHALGRSWSIDPADACLVASSLLEVLPHFVDPDAAAGFSATYGLHLRGGPEVTLEFRDGSLAVRDGRPPRADCRISADPVAYLLNGYGRVPAARVALSGKVVAYGRKPWLGFKLASLIRSP